MQPFLKWAGGKRRLLKKITLPRLFNRIVEPFAGSAAVTFSRDDFAILNDKCSALMNCYQQIKQNPDMVFDDIPRINNLETYLDIRESRSYETNAGHFIYLNKTCYGGLWRVNSDGEMNVPYGDYINPRLPSRLELRNVSKRLSCCDLYNTDFAQILEKCTRQDFIFIDPPYDEMFNSYTIGGFTDQRRLATLVNIMRENGFQIAVCNSDTPLIRELYKNFNIREIGCHDGISTHKKTRKELYMTTY